MSATITCEKYGRGYVVRGDTKEYKEELKTIGGKWNANLKEGGPGWIFASDKLDSIKKLIKKTKNSPKKKGDIEESSEKTKYVTFSQFSGLLTKYNEMLSTLEKHTGKKEGEQIDVKAVLEKVKLNDYVKNEVFLSLVTRFDKLQAVVENIVGFKLAIESDRMISDRTKKDKKESDDKNSKVNTEDESDKKKKKVVNTEDDDDDDDDDSKPKGRLIRR